MRSILLTLCCFCLAFLVNAQITYDLEWGISTYDTLTDYNSIIDENIFSNGFSIDEEVTFELDFDFPFFDDRFTTLYLDGSGYGYFNPLGDEYNLQLFAGEYENFSFLTAGILGYSESDWRYKYDIERDLNVFKVEWNNVGLYDDVTSGNPSDHSLNYQIWFFENGDIEVHFGVVDLENSPNFDAEQGLIWDDGEVHGPWLGILDDSAERAYFFTDSFTEPAFIYSNEDADVMKGEAPLGWFARFIYNDPLAITSNAKLDAVFQVYPTLVKDQLNIEMRESLVFSKIELSVTNTLGQILKSEILDKNISSIDLNSLPNGIYYVQLLTDWGITKSKRIIKI